MSTLKLVESDGYYSLQFDEKPLYLSVFRGYRMQVSATAEGDYNHGSSEITLAPNLEVIKYDYQGTHKDALNSAIIYGHIYTAVSSIPGFFEAILANTELVNKWLDHSGEIFDIIDDLKVSPDWALSLVKPGSVHNTNRHDIVTYVDQENRKVSFNTDYNRLVLNIENEDVHAFNYIDIVELFDENGIFDEILIIENALIPVLAWKSGVQHNSKVLLNSKRFNIKKVARPTKDLTKSAVFGTKDGQVINIR